MGIPSYYSAIIQKNKFIFCVLGTVLVDHFFMDCNSIIYDTVNSFPYESFLKDHSPNELDDFICLKVIEKIEYYIQLINPSRGVYIAFDGVAPVAKLQQQRDRRFKSWYQSQTRKSIFNEKQTRDYFDTAKITPGTKFMDKLAKHLISHFQPELYPNIKLLSTSKEPGEGEQKLFQYMRDMSSYESGVVVVYGLDADLIMLSLSHLALFNNIYFFRDTPVYIKSLNQDLDPTINYLMNIYELSLKIAADMGLLSDMSDITSDLSPSLIPDPKIQRHYDLIYNYIFMSFLLGNDFLPHFPAINIRTGGMEKLFKAYQKANGDFLTVNMQTSTITIHWNNFSQFIGILASLEENYILDEFLLRKRRRLWQGDTKEDKFRKFENIPQYERDVEIYIDPGNKGWQHRYYESLLDTDIKKLSQNYIQGLVWNIRYYVIGCPHWEWKYDYAYPPLLTDLWKHIPGRNETCEMECKGEPVTELEQLCYVLPKQSLYLLPSKIKTKLIAEKSHWYVNNTTFSWAFCKYFWESHPDLPKISIQALKKITR